MDTNLFVACAGALTTAVVLGAVHIGQRLNNVVVALNDFPPHRHINGSIIYPRGFEPTEVQKLRTQ